VTGRATDLETRFAVGIDLGGTKVRAGIAGLDGRIQRVLTQPTAAEGGRALVSQVVTLVQELASAVGAGPSSVVATAIGGAGVPDRTGAQFHRAPNLGDLDGFNLAEDVAAELGHPVILENDVNIAAIGELHAGVGAQHDSFAFVSVGTGIGVGLVLGRRLWTGANGAAGEIGYIPMGTDPLDPANQHRGPLEEVVAGEAIARRVATQSGETDLDAAAVFERAANGDMTATSSLDEEAKWLAHALVTVDAVVNPGLFVLGGGIGTRTELLGPIRQWLHRLGRADLEVRISELGGDAPIVGAIRLAIDTALQQRESETS
jgi:predicted NBD/HSP70 family sugar kinase